MKKISKKISDHISFKEATYSATAKRLGIKNTPSEDHIENMAKENRDQRNIGYFLHI